MELERLLAPLELVEAGGGSVTGRTRFQKLMFLAQQQSGNQWFPYIAHDYGPYSKELQVCLNTLVGLRLLAEKPTSGRSDSTAYRYELTDPGRAFLHATSTTHRQKAARAMKEVQAAWKGKPLDELIRFVYQQYPTFAANSKLQMGP